MFESEFSLLKGEKVRNLREHVLYTMGKNTLRVFPILLLIASMALVGVRADPSPYFSLNPMEIAVQAGESFMIDVNVTDVTDLGAWEFKLSYNTTLLDAVEVIPGPASENVTDWLPINATGHWSPINDTLGRVRVGALFPWGQEFTGNGTLVTINFTATEVGNCTLDLYDTKLYDALGDPIDQDPPLDGSVIVDSTSPTTLHDYKGLWHTTDFTINLTATGGIGGVAETYYKINDDSIQNVSAHGQPLITTESDDNKLEYWSVDNYGNEELPHKILTGIKLDKTAPTGSIAVNNNATYANSTSVTLTLIATDATSGVAEMCFSNDSITYTDWETYASSKSWNLQDGDGAKTVYVQFRDQAGLISTYSDTIILDTTAPTIGVPSRIPDDDILPEQEVKVSVSVTDVVSGVKTVTLSYTIDDGITWTNLPMNYNSSTGLYEATIPPQQAGTWVKYKIVTHDNAENQGTKDGAEPYCIYQVIPEFPSAIILPLFMVVAMLAVVFAKRRFPKKSTPNPKNPIFNLSSFTE